MLEKGRFVLSFYMLLEPIRPVLAELYPKYYEIFGPISALPTYFTTKVLDRYSDYIDFELHTKEVD